MKKIILTLVLGLTVSLAFAQLPAIRVNALGAATGTANIGVDIPMSHKWSIEGSVMCNPIKTDRLSMQLIGGTIGVRKWQIEPHVGIFWGVHSTTALYDFTLHNRRKRGWTTGVGSSVGYTWMLSQHINFTLEGGLALYYTSDKRPIVDADRVNDIIIRHSRRIVLAPSKLEVSFSYQF